MCRQKNFSLLFLVTFFLVQPVIHGGNSGSTASGKAPKKALAKRQQKVFEYGREDDQDIQRVKIAYFDRGLWTGFRAGFVCGALVAGGGFWLGRTLANARTAK